MHILFVFWQDDDHPVQTELEAQQPLMASSSYSSLSSVVSPTPSYSSFTSSTDRGSSGARMGRAEYERLLGLQARNVDVELQLWRVFENPLWERAMLTLSEAVRGGHLDILLLSFDAEL